MIEILWHGRGGQGAFTAARLLGAAASLDDGRHALAFPSFGPERRGAPMRAFTKLSDEPIGDRSAVAKADYVIYLDDTLLGEGWENELKPGGVVLVNSVRVFDDRRIVALDADGIETPGVAYRRLGLYGYGKRPEPKSRRWTGTQVQKIVGDPVYTGTLVTGKTRRRVMNRHPVDVVPESERYVTEGAHPALVADGLWRAAQACLRTKEHLKGVGKSAPKSPFARGLLRRAECGHSLSYRAWKAGGAFTCKCDCAGGDRRRVTEDEVADAIAAAMREGGSTSRPCAEREPDRKPKPRVTAAAKLAAYERYAFGKATAADLEVLGTPATAAAQHAAASASLLPSGADRLLEADGEKERAALLSALEEHRLDDVDRALLRRIVEKVLVREGPRLEVVMR